MPQRASPARTEYLQRIKAFLDELKRKDGMTREQVDKFLLNMVSGQRARIYIRDLEKLGAIKMKDGRFICTDGRKISEA